MVGRRLPWLLALAPWSLPASAAITIEQAQISDGGGLVIAGQVTPTVRTVTLTIGPVTSIILTPDGAGRFMWIDQQVPPECAVSVTAGGERVVTGIAGCGANAALTVEAARTTTSAYSYGSSDVRTNQPAAGGGATTQISTYSYGSTDAHTDQPAAGGGEIRTTRRILRPTFVSPNDPRYAQTEPDHWGEAPVQGTSSTEMLPPSRGFYAGIRSMEAGGN
jgi:hypothetical protein